MRLAGVWHSDPLGQLKCSARPSYNQEEAMESERREVNGGTDRKGRDERSTEGEMREEGRKGKGNEGGM